MTEPELAPSSYASRFTFKPELEKATRDDIEAINRDAVLIVNEQSGPDGILNGLSGEARQFIIDRLCFLGHNAYAMGLDKNRNPDSSNS